MVTGRYPGLSLTFIDREVRAMRAMGVEVISVSVRSPDPENLSGAFQRAEAGRVIQLIASARRPAILLGALFLAVRRPRRLAAAVWLAVATCPAGGRAVLRQGAYLAEAVLLAWHMSGRNVAHIHNHLGDSSGTVVLLASELTGIPFSMTLHGPEIFIEPRRWRLDVKIARARFVACISRFCRAQAMLSSEPTHWHKLKVVRCGVDPSIYRADGLPRTGSTLLFVGRLERRKGVDVLLEALKRLRATGHDVYLTIVGDGPERSVRERQAADALLRTAVTFAGACDENGVAEAMRTADLLIVPSLSEGLPVVIIEALASGVPVVATAVGGNPELVRDGETGLLVPPADPDKLAAAIVRLLSDPDLRRRMGVAGRRLVCRDHNAGRNARALLRRIAEEDRKVMPCG
jgi:glycosyltransferase involved in cell wall biosynthesis